MTDRTILQRNKAVLWARDVISRSGECVIATGDKTNADALTFIEVDPNAVGTCTVEPQSPQFEELAQHLVGKEVVVAAVSDRAVQSLREKSIAIHDLFEYYRLFVNNPDAQLAEGVPASELGAWVRNMLQRMAGSSLVLDQADTGAGKWTSAHFKPNASVFDKLKTIIKG